MRDTFLGRLCPKECARIDCDTKYEWISDMKKLFENWRKHLNEGGAKNYGHYEPGRAVADIDTGEDYVEPEDLMRDEVQDLADKFDVEASVEVTLEGTPVIFVYHQNGDTSVYVDSEDMYQDLAKSHERAGLNEEEDSDQRVIQLMERATESFMEIFNSEELSLITDRHNRDMFVHYLFENIELQLEQSAHHQYSDEEEL